MSANLKWLFDEFEEYEDIDRALAGRRMASRLNCCMEAGIEVYDVDLRSPCW